MASSTTASPQGGVRNSLWAMNNDGDPHVDSHVWNVGRAAFSASVFYRERYSGFVDLGFDLTLAHRSFNASYSDGGLGGGSSTAARAELDQLYIGVKPEVRLDAKRSAVVHFGFMAGFLVGGSAKGTSSSWSAAGPGSRNEDADLTNNFGGDLRFAFGLGFRVPVSDRWVITIDPEWTIAFTTMLKQPAGMRGSDIGMRIGLSRLSNGRSLTSFIKDGGKDRKAEPIW